LAENKIGTLLTTSPFGLSYARALAGILEERRRVKRGEFLKPCGFYVSIWSIFLLWLAMRASLMIALSDVVESATGFQ